MRIVFATTTCGRCGGTGRYSYNQMTGSTCFACGGGTIVLTRSGKRARSAYDAYLAAHNTRPASEIAVGDRVFVPAQLVSVNGALLRFHRALEVVAVHVSISNGRSIVVLSVRVKLRSNYGGWLNYNAEAGILTYSEAGTAPVRLGTTEEILKGFAAAHPTLTGYTIEREPAAAALEEGR